MGPDRTPRPTHPPGQGIDPRLMDPELSQQAQANTSISTIPASISLAASTSASEASLPSISASETTSLILDNPQVIITSDVPRPFTNRHGQAHAPQECHHQSSANRTNKPSTNEMRDQRLASHKQELDQDWGGRDNWARQPYVKSPEAAGLNLITYLRSLTKAALNARVELSSLWDPNAELHEECNVSNKPQPLTQERARRALDAFKKNHPNPGDNETDRDSNLFTAPEAGDGDSTHDSPTSGLDARANHTSSKRARSPSGINPPIRIRKRARCDDQDDEAGTETIRPSTDTTTTSVASSLPGGTGRSQSVGPRSFGDRHDLRDQGKNGPQLSLNALEQAGVIRQFDPTEPDIDERLIEARGRLATWQDLSEAIKLRAALFEPFNAIKATYDQAQRVLGDSPDTVWDSATEKHAWEQLMARVNGICGTATSLFTADKCRGATSEITKEALKTAEAEVKTLEQEKKRLKAKRKLQDAINEYNEAFA